MGAWQPERLRYSAATKNQWVAEGFPERRQERSGGSGERQRLGEGFGSRPTTGLLAWEDVESGAPYDRDFLKPFEPQAKSVKLETAGHEAVQLKAIAADGK